MIEQFEQRKEGIDTPQRLQGAFGGRKVGLLPFKGSKSSPEVAEHLEVPKQITNNKPFKHRNASDDPKKEIGRLFAPQGGLNMYVMGDAFDERHVLLLV